jgi:hypothetical protein
VLIFKAMTRFVSLFIICSYIFSIPTFIQAQDCEISTENILFYSCNEKAIISLRFHPLELSHDADNILSVTGAYSSGDRFGVEGLAFDGPRLVSSRFQGWDGIFLVSPDGSPYVFNSKDIDLWRTNFDLTIKKDRKKFIELAQAKNWSMIQSHLLISDGVLDLYEVENARRFVRRMFFTNQSGWGIYQTKTSLTLFEAANEIKSSINPDMVINLDMGTYNYCQRSTNLGPKACGELLTNSENLTNLITIKLTEKN